jgi:CheY-like chemotaxis protein
MPNWLEKKAFLVVDDFGDMRSSLRSMLATFGAGRIDTAANGKDAIALMEHNKYDVVLCDYNLGPGKDGQQVLEEARHRSLLGLSSVFVMITAENTREMVLGAIEYEPDNYLAKPFTKDLLRNRLEKVLIKKQDLAEISKAVERRDFAGAIRLLDARIAARPKNLAEITRLKAELCLRAGELDAAGAIYEQLLALREIPWARLGLAKVFFARGQYPETLDTLQELVYGNEPIAAAHDLLAKAHQALGQLQAAQDVLAAAVALSPKAILRQKALGELALKNKDFKLADRAFGQAVSLAKHSVFRHPSLYSGLVEAKVASDNDKEAKAALDLVRQMEREFGTDPDAQLYSAMSESLVQRRIGNEEAAQQALARADQIYERRGVQSNPELTIALASVAARLGLAERAETLFRSAVQNNHENEDVLREVEAAYRDSGLSATPETMVQEVRRAVVELNNRGVHMASSGRVEEAIGLFEQAADGMAGNKVINLNAAKVLIVEMERKGVDAEYLGKVRKYLDRVRKLDPRDAGLTKVTQRLQKLAAMV